MYLGCAVHVEYFRLEAYDRNANFMEVDDTVCDASDWKMDLPDPKTFRDVTSSSCLPPVSESNVSAFLQLHGASIDKISKELYKAR